MTIKYFMFNTSGAGSQWNISAGNGVDVAAGVTVGSTDSFAITGTGADIGVNINGALYGETGGLALLNTANSVVRIGEQGEISGNVSGGSALTLTDSGGTIENRGLLTGDSTVDVFNTSGTQFTNFGTIIASEHGVELESGSSGTFSLFNLADWTLQTSARHSDQSTTLRARQRTPS